MKLRINSAAPSWVLALADMALADIGTAAACGGREGAGFVDKLAPRDRATLAINASFLSSCARIHASRALSSVRLGAVSARSNVEERVGTTPG